MVELDDYAMRAVASPVADPPTMSRIEGLAGRRRRRRIALLATAVVGLFGVIGVASLAIVSDSKGGSTVDAVGTAGDGASAANTDLSTFDLMNGLTRAGDRVTSDGTASGFPLAPTAQLLCANGTKVIVYEYTDRASRVAVSDTISADGFAIGRDGVIYIMEWVVPPHFFANGRVIVLVLGDDARLLQTLSRLMGPTISPDAPPNGPAGPSCNPSSG